MGVFHSKQSKDYEKVLTCLQSDIKNRQNSLQGLKTISRTCQVHLVLFSSVFYAGYSLYLFLQLRYVGSISKQSTALLVFFPVSVFGIKRLINAVFRWLINRREMALKSRQDELKNRIEEIKVETKYNETKNLIEKYSITESSDPKPSSGIKKRTVSTDKIVLKNPNHLNTNTSTRISTNKNANAIARPVAFNPNSQMRPFSPPPPPPQVKIPTPTWMDRFMDALIGDDSRNQKFALICSQCFNHNGLVPPEAFENVKYRCPNCGFFNVNKRKPKDEPANKTENEKSDRIEEVKSEAESTKST